MRKLIFLFLVVSWTSSVSAAVVRLSFTTEPQTISPGIPSAKLTIQAQDSSGAETKADSTIHLKLESSSATGKFSSDDNWDDSDNIYISKNTANRSFYYRDSSAGTPTLTVSALEGEITPATQTITIGSAGAGGTTPPPAGGGQSSETTTVITGNGSLSAHASQTDLSAATGQKLSLGAGRERLALVFAPVELRAVGKDWPAGATFTWSLGDGRQIFGERVAPSYFFPGDYQVVLNVRYGGGEEAVARTKVKVVAPQIAITDVNYSAGYVELRNQAGAELNLYGGRLVCDNRYFSFPRDTLVPAGGYLKIPLTITGCPESRDWSIVFGPTRVASFQSGQVTALNQEKLATLRARADYLAQELAKFTDPAALGAVAPESASTETAVLPAPLQEATVITLDQAPIDSGGLLGWLKNIFQRSTR